MSGGSHDYLYSRIEEEYCGAMHDIELNDLMTDIVNLLHDLEWYDSGDYGEDTYREAVNGFKQKWFGTSREDRLKRYIDMEVSSVRKELYELISVGEVEESDDQESDFGPWIPCDEKLPEKSGYYNVLVIDDDGKRSICCGMFNRDAFNSNHNCVAWKPVCAGTVVSWREYPAPKV